MNKNTTMTVTESDNIKIVKIAASADKLRLKLDQALRTIRDMEQRQPVDGLYTCPRCDCLVEAHKGRLIDPTHLKDY